MKSIKEIEWFYSQEKIPCNLMVEAPYSIYRLKSTGQTVCEHTMDLGLGEYGCQITVMGDTHFNNSNAEDDLDEETVYTKFKRTWGNNGKHIDRTRLSLQAAAFSDQIVLVGDIIDYLTKAAMADTKKYIIDAYPDALLTVGWHDITKQMQTRRPNLLTDDERLDILQEIWPNDIHYCTKDINAKITAVCMGHAHCRYTKDFSDKLAADIERARAEGRYILVFQHEPLATGLEKDKQAPVCYDRLSENPVTSINLYDGDKRICSIDDTIEYDWKIFKLLTENADVVKGIFVGHEHVQCYTEIPASYMKDGKKIETVIPQHIAACTAYHPNGFYMRIIVK